MALFPASSGGKSDTGWQTVGTSGYAQYLSYRVKDGYCTLVYNAQSAMAYGAGWVELTSVLPAEARPNVRASGAAFYSGSCAALVVYGGSSGLVYLYTASASTASVFATMTYPVG